MRICVGSPVYAGRDHISQEALMNLVDYARRENVYLERVTVTGDGDVGRARGNVAATFLNKTDCDVMLSIDHDIWFEPKDAIRLCRLACEGYSVIGGLYVTRGGAGTQPASLMGDGQTIVFAPDQEPVEVHFLATGFMAITRQVFERMKEHPEVKLCMQSTLNPFWDFYLQKHIPWPGDDFLYLSEDYAFCQRAKEMGYKIWLDPTIRLGHVGKALYRLETMAEFSLTPCWIELTRNSNGHIMTRANICDADEARLKEMAGVTPDSK